MPFLTGEVAVRQSTDEAWELLEELAYQGRKETFRVPAGFVTDLASVPHFFTWLVPRYGRYTRAAVLHDYLCLEAHAGRFNRHDADGIFRRTMRELGVGFLRRWIMWTAVRVGSGWGGLWKGGFAKGLGVLALALLCAVFFLVPVAVVGAWLLAFWVLEWVTFIPLKIASRRKAVNKPRSLVGT